MTREYERLCRQLAQFLRNKSVTITGCYQTPLRWNGKTIERARDRDRTRAEIIIIFDRPSLEEEPVAGKELCKLIPIVSTKKVLYLRGPDKQKATNQFFEHADIVIAPWHKVEALQDEAWEEVAVPIRRAIESRSRRTGEQTSALLMPAIKPWEQVAGLIRRAIPSKSRHTAGKAYGFALAAGVGLTAILVFPEPAAPLYEMVLNAKSPFLAEGLISPLAPLREGRSTLCRGDAFDVKLVPAVAYRGPVVAEVLSAGRKLPIEFQRNTETGTLRLRGTSIFTISPGETLDVEIVLRKPGMLGFLSSKQHFTIKLQQDSHCR